MKAKQKDCSSILILHRSILLERCWFFNPFFLSWIVHTSLGCN